MSASSPIATSSTDAPVGDAPVGDAPANNAPISESNARGENPRAPLWKRLIARREKASALAASPPIASEAADTALEEQSQTREAELIVAVFRTLILLLAFLSPRLLGLSGEYEMTAVWLATLASVYNIATGISCLRPDRYGLRRSFIVAMDMMLITLWIHLSGQWELFPFYYLVVVVAAMWFKVFGGILAATFSNFFFLFLWSRTALEIELTRPPTFTTSMALGVLLLFLVGCLVGYIAEIQERERESRLESQLLVANYQREIDLSSQLQPLLFAPPTESLERDAPLELGVASQSARTLGGGDYADAIRLPDGSTLLCIADVAGKSVRAQARLPLLKYSLRALAPLYPEPSELVKRLNETLAPDLSVELYIAFCCVRLDGASGTLRWCNAGHIAPLLVRRDDQGGCEIMALETSGPPLGMFPDVEYSVREAKWRGGDHLLLHTDGLAEALSYNGTEDGEAQVKTLAARLAHEAHRLASEVAGDFIALSNAALEAADAPSERLRAGLSSLRPRVGGQDANTRASHRDDITVVVARAK